MYSADEINLTSIDFTNFFDLQGFAAMEELLKKLENEGSWHNP